jgi:hypothetical protein
MPRPKFPTSSHGEEDSALAQTAISIDPGAAGADEATSAPLGPDDHIAKGLQAPFPAAGEAEAGREGSSKGIAPFQDMQFRLHASFDQLPEPHVRKLPRALRLGLFIVPPVLLWAGISWLVRSVG